MTLSDGIQTAELDWTSIDGIDIPVSKQFGDVYFSKDNGLLETRHVFLNGNDLTTRLSQLHPFQYFCIGETGFGTGLNILALWQLWQQVRPDNNSHLHVISVEKYPLRKTDLIKALQAWPELQPLVEQLLSQYPHPIAGCHRLNFPHERFSLDLWLGDAHDVFPEIALTQTVNAWFLDGFAPACNPELWEQHVLNHIVRLSGPGTSFASFSVAGVLKRGLSAHGIHITRPRGFGHKREMLKATWVEQSLTSSTVPAGIHKQQHIAVIGAGIAGLNMAWALAERGHQVVLFEREHPLSGGSGNPLALLNPKLSPITQSHAHLMTLAWQYALPFYRPFKAYRSLHINQLALKQSENVLDLAAQYPQGLLRVQSKDESPLKTRYSSLHLTEAGALSPHQFCEQILRHPLIRLEIAHVERIKEVDQHVQVIQNNHVLMHADYAVVCGAADSAALITNFPKLKSIRGQVSWCNNTAVPLVQDQAFSYGGYCLQLDPKQLILGASFHPGRADTDVLTKDHVHNFDLIHSVFPEYAEQLPPPSTWQGRASLRAQSADYFPLLGHLEPHSRIFSFAGLGSKGFLFAPLSSEILAALILGQACPVPKTLLQKLNPQRFIKKTKVRKPYYQAPPTTS